MMTKMTEQTIDTNIPNTSKQLADIALLLPLLLLPRSRPHLHRQALLRPIHGIFPCLYPFL